MTEAILPTKGVGAFITIDGVEIGEVTSMPSAGGGQTGQIEVTHFRSAAKEYLADLPDNGEVSMTVNVVPMDEGQRKAWAKRVNQDTVAFVLTMPFTPPLQLSGSGTLTQFAFSMAVGQQISANITIRVSGEISGFPAEGS